MKILVVASEAVPYFKSGGLADVARALPDALERAGHEVRILHPLYADTAHRFPKLERDCELPIPWPDGVQNVRFLLHQPAVGARAVLVQHSRFFDVPEPYTSTVDPLAPGERFAFFSRAALHYAACWGADVIHLNDWQTGLVPVYALVDELRLPTVFSIHNLAYQGNFPPEVLGCIGVPVNLYRTENGLEFYQNVCFMKGGLAFADRLTTVSPTYAQEIQTHEYGAGLDGLLRFRSRVLHGILNGLDTEAWNPATDQALAQTYSVRTTERKDANRTALLEELRLDDRGPLLVVVSRLAHQKGIDLLLEALPRLIEHGNSIAVLGDGNSAMEHAFARAIARFPRRIAAAFRFDDSLARRFYAGGDFFLMPSRYEPCGLGQMIAQRYGNVPIVRHTGGLADTVEDGKTGFAFPDATADSLLRAVLRATRFWRGKEWERLRRRCMRVDHSWSRSALQYEAVYSAAIGPILP